MASLVMPTRAETSGEKAYLASAGDDIYQSRDDSVARRSIAAGAGAMSLTRTLPDISLLRYLAAIISS